jgi:hypothetical protein
MTFIARWRKSLTCATARDSPLCDPTAGSFRSFCHKRAKVVKLLRYNGSSVGLSANLSDGYCCVIRPQDKDHLTDVSEGNIVSGTAYS